MDVQSNSMQNEKDYKSEEQSIKETKNSNCRISNIQFDQKLPQVIDQDNFIDETDGYNSYGSLKELRGNGVSKFRPNSLNSIKANSLNSRIYSGAEEMALKNFAQDNFRIKNSPSHHRILYENEKFTNTNIQNSLISKKITSNVSSLNNIIMDGNIRNSKYNIVIQKHTTNTNSNTNSNSMILESKHQTLAQNSISIPIES